MPLDRSAGVFAGWTGSQRFAGGVLAVLLLFLPLFDPPTNLMLVALLGSLLATLFRTPGAFAPRELNAGHLAFVLLLAASLGSTVSNLPFPDQFRGVREVFGLLVVYFAVSRLPLDDKTVRWLFWWLVVGALIAALWGSVDLARQKIDRLGLHAVGGAARAGIYLGVIIIAGFGLLLHVFSRAGASLAARATTVACWAALCVALVLTGSRGAMLGVGAGALLFLIANRRRISRRLALAALGLVLVSGLVLSLLPGHMTAHRFVSNTLSQLQSGNLDQNDSLRLTLQKYGVEVFRQADNPWVGVGTRNFHMAKPAVSPAMTAALKDFEGRVPHAHNLFINKLAEEGVFGVAALLFLFGVIARWLWQDARAGRAGTLAWAIGLGGLVAPIVGGSFNTPWFRENALLATICFALYAAARRSSAAGRQPA